LQKRWDYDLPAEPDMLVKPEQPVGIVTGSTSGIGLAVARMLVNDRGFRVCFNSVRSHDTGSALAKSMPETMYVQADVSQEAEAERLVAEVIGRWGRIDVLVNNAGRTITIPHQDLAAIDSATFASLLSTNLLGSWNMIRACVDSLRASRGSVINMSSLAGLRPRGSSIPYAVSKAGLNHLTALLAKALAPDVRVNAIAAGYIDTPFVAEMPDMRAEWLERAPLRRCGDPDDVVRACRYLLEADFVTGDVMVVDGGMHLL
jgi:ketoreductase RED2